MSKWAKKIAKQSGITLKNKLEETLFMEFLTGDNEIHPTREGIQEWFKKQPDDYFQMEKINRQEILDQLEKITDERLSEIIGAADSI